MLPLAAQMMQVLNDVLNGINSMPSRTGPTTGPPGPLNPRAVHSRATGRHQGAGPESPARHPSYGERHAMESPFAEQIRQAMASLQEHRARMQEAQLELQAATASVTSEDRMVTAVVGPQGQVVSLTFHTDDYRDMAPEQLGRVLTDVLNEARAQMGEKVIATMRDFQGTGDMLRQSMVGGM
ncbi:YbaB/EbfC family nucleoid-associated protein [Kitasatospora sp. NPDC052896]|uniref:YbaB/EbfC family nucleoid-associated protein n=1 Tax=Kitasatospora sp. NPDC052896 TaxID=3364061 RepID=UPI0037C5BE6A